MYEQHFVASGLTKDQSVLYETLVRTGALSASLTARRAHVPRTRAYVALTQLQSMGLVSKEKIKGSVATFSAAHPFKLQELARSRLHIAEQANTAVDGVLAAVISEFNTASGQPGIRILEGVEGVRELYSDILRERQNISLIRSPNDAKFPELKSLVERQIREQVRVGISARVITPQRDGSIVDMVAEDKKVRRIRHIIPDPHFKPPAQMIIYGNKVALTAYNEQIITTIIENKDIHTTCMLMFEYMWSATRNDHDRLVAKENIQEE